MRIGIVGSGNVGSALGKRWAALGHEVVFGSRNPESPEMKKLLSENGPKTSAASQAEAAKCEMVLLATPWPATEQIVSGLGDLTGRILIDATNPMLPDLSALELGTNTSAGEQVAEWAKGARVVKAFNMVGAGIMADTSLAGGKPVLFYCGDDEDAKKQVHGLAADIGFDARDAGPITQARVLEPLAMLWVSLAFTRGYGTGFAFSVVGSAAAK